MADQLIASIPKNAREEIRIALSEFNGHNLANLRICFTVDDGTMKPGNKGLAFKLEKLPVVLQALNDLEAGARRLGPAAGGSSPSSSTSCAVWPTGPPAHRRNSLGGCRPSPRRSGSR